MNYLPHTPQEVTIKTAGRLIQALALGAATLIPAQATASPSSSAQSSAVGKTCTSPYTPPVAALAPSVEMPTIADEQGVMSGESIVEVSLSSKGDVIRATIEKSSGNRWLDNAALRTTRTTLFIPATTNCEPVGGTYLYAVDF
jgi:TonB family protein